jgi:putative ABC transport system substrate-binding protein
MNNRRKLVIALGAGAFVGSLASLAQKHGKVWRVGFLYTSEQSFYIKQLDAFKAGMRDRGYVEGRDFVIDQRSAQNDIARLPDLAELLALKVDIILATGTPPAQAARKVTRDIPIVTVGINDPVGSGLVATLSRPEGNVTGLTNGVASELFSKRLDLLRQMLPAMRRVGFLHNPDNAGNVIALRQFEADCTKLGFKPIGAPVRKPEEIAAVFSMLKREKAQGLIVTPTAANRAWRDTIIELAMEHRLPTIYGFRFFVEAGGLISYGSDDKDLWRRAAVYVDKILKGAKPGDLPIEQPLKFELLVNLKSAKTLGIKIPNSILVQATQVIE